MANIKFISLSSHGFGLSGGDRIWIEFARNWSRKNKVEVITWKEGYQMALRQKLEKSSKLKFKLLKNKLFESSFIVSYLLRIIEGIRWSFIINVTEHTLVYSSSEFWMDSIPAFILKLRNRKNTWVATWYQTASNPLSVLKDKEKHNLFRITGILYWLSQLLIKPLIRYFADFVLVNNQLEKLQFNNLNKKGRVLVVLGAVGLETIDKWKLKQKKKTVKKYDAVFQGRFHPQKGVVELITIWKKVCNKKPLAKLIMIGDGPLMSQVKQRIEDEKLESNVILKGYLFDGSEKYQLFAESRIVLHPAVFDSGGMAAAEAMAFGLPIVGFDLPAYKSYYPQGMVKVKEGDINSFSKAILKLLNDSKLRTTLGKKGEKYIYQNWSWELRAKEVLSQIKQ